MIREIEELKTENEEINSQITERKEGNQEEKMKKRRELTQE